MPFKLLQPFIIKKILVIQFYIQNSNNLFIKSRNTVCIQSEHQVKDNDSLTAAQLHSCIYNLYITDQYYHRLHDKDTTQIGKTNLFEGILKR